MELYEIYYMGKTYFYCSGAEDLFFNGITYRAIPIERNEINLTVDTNGAIVTFPIDAQPFAYFVTNPNVKLATIKIKKYPQNFVFFEGSVLTCDFNYVKRIVKVTIGSKYILKDVTIPKRSYSRYCSFNFCDENCGLNLANYKVTLASGTYEMPRADTIVSDLLKDLSFNLISGYIVTSKDEKQFIMDYNKSSGTITLLKPIFFTDISHINVYAGCTKTLNDCIAYNNAKRFGGFPYIPNKNLYSEGF